ncbi:DMT family transporter [Metaclostridioides mangenotii]|uniref:Drug/metabolite transporter (DMT)-like permease n=1 Tax=Metaclostridioides mangenotii TaxID=1540 RepID=A0ABS4ED01_9FIRM|nr:DMT family transporter [Clostridioides mangenotii]MBP1855832.1 drug/metabolite transporter (DMT)-like permease [Clostridioides mangenotii]
MNDTIKGSISAVLYSTLIGLSFLFSKIALVEGNTIDILAHRFTSAFIAIFLYTLITKKRKVVSKSDIIALLPLSLVSPVLYFSLQLLGLSMSSSSEGGIIQSTIPIFTMIFGIILLKEKPSLRQKIFTFISMFGVLFVFIAQGNTIDSKHLLGIILLTLSSLALSLYNVMARKDAKQYNVIQMTYAMTLFGCIVFNVVSIIKHLFSSDIQSYFAPLASMNYIGAVLYLGIMSSLVSFILSNYALSKLEASKMGVYLNLTVVVAVFAGAIFLKESITFIHVIGVAIILIGVLGANLSNPSTANKDVEDSN